MRKSHSILLSIVGLALVGGLSGQSASADAISDFYKKTRLKVIVGYSPGGGFDRGGRVVGRHIGKYIPGTPKTIVQNMPGGGSMRSLNWLAQKAPKNGAAIAHFHPAAVREHLLGGKGVKFDPRKFTWLGSYNRERAVTFVRAGRGIKNIQDAMEREVIIGATSPRSGGGAYPQIMNHVLGTRFKVVVGYGSTGESTLAMERGEVHGIGSWSWSQIKSRKKKWLKDKFINVLIHVSIAKHPDLPHVPTPLDLAKTKGDRDVLEMIFGYQELGRPFAAPPGTHAERGKALQAAFNKMVKQEDFKKAIEIAGLEVSAMDNKQVMVLLNKFYGLPAKTLNRGKTIYAEMRSGRLSKAKKKKTKGLKLVKVKGKGRKMKLSFKDKSGKTWKFKAREKKLGKKLKINGKKAKVKNMKPGMVCTISYYGVGGLAYSANCKS
ncbi:MAG: Bug family tripartite tricarboxylate transporter substrate binding protein [Alphaproteobacteria bacterium]|jgi:tripartite-type tricarboxylate transporter receptor subunit TctC